MADAIAPAHCAAADEARILTPSLREGNRIEFDGEPGWFLVDAAAIAALFGRERASNMQKVKSRAGRPPQPVWAEIEPAATDWLEENGAPVEGSGEQAEFERLVAELLSAKGHHAAESTVREHCKRWIKRFEAQRRSL